LREVGHDGYIYLVDPRVILTPLDYIKLSKKTTPRSDLTRIATKLGVKIHTPDVDLYRGEILRIMKSLNVTEPIKTRYTTKRVVTKPRDFNLRNNVNNLRNNANNLRNNVNNVNNLRNNANNLRNNVNNVNNVNNSEPFRVTVPGNGRVALKMPEVEKKNNREKEMPKVPEKPKMPEVEKKNNGEKEMPKVPGKPKMLEVEKKNNGEQRILNAINNTEKRINKMEKRIVGNKKNLD
jgi:hypothetical protein